MAMKVCATCHENKSVAEYGSHRRAGDGLQARCRPCLNAKNKEGYWRDPERANSSKRTETGRNHKAGYDKARRERFRKRMAVPTPTEKVCGGCGTVKLSAEFHRSKTHGDGLAPRCKACKHQYDMERQARDGDRLREQSRQWARTHRDAVRRYSDRYKSMLLVSGNLTGREWMAILKKYGGICLRCGSSERLTRDHVLPISMGGTTTAANIQPLCRSCNSSKNAKYIDYRPDWQGIPQQIGLFMRGAA